MSNLDEQVTPEPAEATDDLSNAAIKAHPLFRKLAAEVKTEREGREALAAEKAERVAAEKAAAEEAEQKRLKDAGLFEEMEAKYKASDAATKAKHAAELLRRDLQNELYKATFTNDKFIKGSIADYDVETCGTVEEYVALLVADEANSKLLGSQAVPPPPGPPGRVIVEGAGVTNWDEVRTWENSKNRDERQKALGLLKAYRETHNGEYPYKND